MLTKNTVALATAAVLTTMGVSSAIWGPSLNRPIEPLAVMAQRPLWVPVEGVGVDKLADSFGAPRSGGRKHKGIDIFAPQGTPVRATAAGTIAGLHLAGKGGIAVYEIDESGKFAYYYAHLNGYASDLKEGMKVAQGQVIGYVGQTGNAATTQPHLHFQIQYVLPGGPWWRGPAVDPYPALLAGEVQEPPPPPEPEPVVAGAGKSDAVHLASTTIGSTKSLRPAIGTKRGTRKYQP
jgi:murein DD-endopeptidase MepM/ murein hydrolase activator NlpD